MISQLLVLVVLIGVNAFFAATEIAFISLNDNKIEKSENIMVRVSSLNAMRREAADKLFAPKRESIEAKYSATYPQHNLPAENHS